MILFKWFVDQIKKRGLNSPILDSAVFHNLVPQYGIKPTLNKQRGRQTLFLGDN